MLEVYKMFKLNKPEQNTTNIINNGDFLWYSDYWDATNYDKYENHFFYSQLVTDGKCYPIFSLNKMTDHLRDDKRFENLENCLVQLENVEKYVSQHWNWNKTVY